MSTENEFASFKTKGSGHWRSKRNSLFFSVAFKNRLLEIVGHMLLGTNRILSVSKRANSNFGRS